MLLPLTLLILVCIGMPIGYAWRLWRLDEPLRSTWFAATVDSTLIVALVFIVGRWDLSGYYTRYLLAALFLGALVSSWRRHAGRPWGDPAGAAQRSRWPSLAGTVLIALLCIYAITGLLPAAGARDLSLPLQAGRFMVGQGGANKLLNHHVGHREQGHAVDITAIDAAGFRAPGLLPAGLESYAVFGAEVVSPCAGTVVAAREGLADLVPAAADPQNPAGNHVVIACNGIEVELAHLRKGSIVVQAGDRLGVGDRIGRVGNSGNTSEPHLHVHAVDPRTRLAVPITFDGRTPVRNTLFQR